MKIDPVISILAALIFTLSSTLQAKPRSCRIVFPERPRNAPITAYLFDGSESLEVTLPSMNLSEVVGLPGGDLTIAMSDRKITNPDLIPPNTPMLRIPEKVTDFYIIITPDPKNLEFPAKMNLVDTGGGKLDPGETLWYNFTKHRIVANLGTSKMSVDPEGRTISKDPVPTSGYYSARFAYQADGEGPFAPITEQHWWHDATSRHLGFIVNTGGKLPRIYFFRDFRLPEADVVETEG